MVIDSAYLSMKNLLSGVLALTLLSASSLFAAEFFPLQVGNTWTYRETTTGQEFKVRVGTPVFTNGQVYYSLSGYTNNRLLVRKNQYQNLVYLQEETGTDLLLASFEPFEGGSWIAWLRPCESDAITHVKRVVHDGPAGPIQDVLDVQYRNFGCADAGLNSEQYAENIGMVQRVVNTIAGPRRFDLVYARLGNLLIDASPHGRFSISLGGTTSDDSFQVTLRLQTNQSMPVRLAFPSAQEYDAVLRDADGNVVWKWSEGRAFAQIAHLQYATDEWTITFRAPRNPTNAPGDQANTYYLQAWLTTDSPAFAATVPFSIGTAPAK
jgi:hypothetical protein